MPRSPLSARSFFRDPIGYVRAHARNGAPLELEAGRTRFVVVRDPQEAWRILVTDGEAFRPGKWKLRARRFVGETLNTLDGEEHRRRRLLLQPALDRRRIARYEPAIAARVERLQEGWADGSRLRLRAELERLSLGVAGDVLLSTELDAQLAGPLLTLMARLPRLTPPLPGTRQARALREVEETVAALVAARERDGGPDDDLLAALLRGGLPERTVRGEVIAFLLAAVSEAPRALEAAWYFLSRHAAAEERVPTDPEYVAAVLRETLRLFPPARHIDRCPVGGDRLNVVVSPLVLHHEPALYESPFAFKPERWLGGNEHPRGAYVPFGAGAHACIGEPLARAIMTNALTGIARRWRLRIDAGVPPPGPRVPPLVATLERR